MSEHEGKTREVRRAQDGVAEGAPHSDRKGTATGRSGTAEHFSFGATGTDSQGTAFGGSIAGGIIGQLIEQTEERINEDKECIAWYERDLEKNERRLASLRQLEQLANQSDKE